MREKNLHQPLLSPHKLLLPLSITPIPIPIPINNPSTLQLLQNLQHIILTIISRIFIVNHHLILSNMSDSADPGSVDIT